MANRQSNHATSGRDVPLFPTPLIVRKAFFSNPQKNEPRISPDGKLLAFVAPRDDVLNVWVSPVADLTAAQAITNDRVRGVTNFSWAFTSRHVLFRQDSNGAEDFHVYAVDVESNEVRDLTPSDGINARIEKISPKYPAEVVLGINDREDGKWHDLYRVNIETGERECMLTNFGVAGFVIDDDFRARLAMQVTPSAGNIYLAPDQEQGWRKFIEVGFEDAMTTRPLGFNAEATQLYLLDSRGRNTAALSALDLSSGETTLIAQNEQADISLAILHPTEKHIQAACFKYERQHWIVLDEAFAEDFQRLKVVAPGEITITSRSNNDRYWTVAYEIDSGPVRFYVYNREEKSARFLFSTHPDLEALPLVNMHAETITTRDGWNLVSYLSLPAGCDLKVKGRPDQPVPMVLLVHGGPWQRDQWEYSPLHQWLANRGYAVLSVNYRGSTGMGKDFVNAANKQWGGHMQDDLVDAVHWAVEQKIADGHRVAIFGGSYGGYAALVALTKTPELFACAVDLFGPSSLVTLWENAPPYWQPAMSVMKTRVGDHTTPAGRAFLESRSPLFYVDRIKRPLLVAHGANDPRCKQSESEQLVNAMNQKGIAVTYLLFENEGHGFRHPQNRDAFLAVMEAFLADHLGGRSEPIGDGLADAAISVPAGSNQITGLSESLSAKISEPGE